MEATALAEISLKGELLMRSKVHIRKTALVVMFLMLSVTVWGQDQILDPIPPVTCIEGDKRVAVMLVGSYHMSNPGLDQFNLEADNVLAPKRQKELENLSNRLVKFKPTKIAVEAPWGDKPTVDRYTAYFEGKREMRKSEEEQIGFRLAKKMGHKEIYAIDVKMPLKDDALKPLIGANPKFQAKMGELNKVGNQAIEIMGKWLSEGTVSYMLYKMNQPDLLKKAHLPYIAYFAPIADGDNYAGADMVATWYQRNLRIFANLTRIAEPGDRIFVIYGMGHIPIIKDLVEDSPDFCTVDPLPYLKE